MDKKEALEVARRMLGGMSEEARRRLLASVKYHLTEPVDDGEDIIPVRLEDALVEDIACGMLADIIADGAAVRAEFTDDDTASRE